MDKIKSALSKLQNKSEDESELVRKYVDSYNAEIKDPLDKLIYFKGAEIKDLRSVKHTLNAIRQASKEKNEDIRRKKNMKPLEEMLANKKKTTGGARKSASRKPASRKPVARKSASRKHVGRKSVARKSASRKPVGRKSVARKSVSRKSVARKPAARKPAARKSVARKPVSRK